MIDYGKAFHTGILVPDLDEAIAFYSRSLGMNFARPFTLEELPVWTPAGGLQTITNRFTFSVEGPLRLELQQSEPGSFFDPAASRGDHVGVWTEDVALTVAELTGKGWNMLAAGGGPDDGWGLFAYLVPAAGGMVVEIASETLRPAFEKWWQGGELVLAP